MADLLERMRKQLLYFSVMLVGESGAGKSSLILRYAQNKFNQSMASTIGIDYLRKKLHYKKKTINLDLWDTSGQDKYRAVSKDRFHRANAVIFVYDMTCPKSIQQVINFWVSTAMDTCLLGTIYTVFGNKSDMLENPQKITEIKNEVDHKLEALSQKYNLKLFHFVGNCKEQQNIGIRDMMDMMVQLLHNKNQIEQQKKLQEQQLQKQRSKLEKPPTERKSVILTASDFKAKPKQKQKKKSCF